MSTNSLRERLRQIRLRTSVASINSTNFSTSTGRNEMDKENSVMTLPTDTRLTKTAPMQNLGGVTRGGTETAEFIPPTPSLTNKPFKSTPLDGEISKHRPLSAVETSSMLQTGTETDLSNQQKQCCSLPKQQSNEPSKNDANTLQRSIPRRAPVVVSRSSSDSRNVKKRSSSSHANNNRQKTSSVSGRHVCVNGHPYLLIDLLGKGGSSKVYQVLDETQKKCRAVKCVDLADADTATKEAYLNEIQLLIDLKDSGCVVQLFDHELRGNHLYMVMEKGDTDLSTFLKTRRSKIDHIFIRFYWSEMLKCVSAIHSKGVVHSDLKPANFLLIGGNLKLIDFGIASSIPSNRTSIMKDSQMGTLSYMPPEALAASTSLDGNNREVYKVQRKSDVWSLGCILYNMVYGRTPYQQFVSYVQKINAIVNIDIEFEQIDDPDLLDVMRKCLEKDPAKRATVEELQQHPYLKKGTESLDESLVYKDENYLLKIAEDLRSCTPRTSARKLRRLMQQKRSGASVDG